MTGDPLHLAGVLLWGTLVGVDLVSFPQAMFNRPLVAATVTGLLTGDMHTALRVGVLLECFALDVVPIGATRYPDFGPAAVVAVATAGFTPWPDPTGVAVLLGLLFALLGGRGMDMVRRLNGRLARSAASALEAGDASALARLQRNGLLADAARAVLVTVLGIGFAAVVLPWMGRLADAGTSLRMVVVAGALAAALTGAARRAGAGFPRLLLGGGLVMGGVLAWLV